MEGRSILDDFNEAKKYTGQRPSSIQKISEVLPHYQTELDQLSREMQPEIVTLQVEARKGDPISLALLAVMESQTKEEASIKRAYEYFDALAQKNYVMDSILLCLIGRYVVDKLGDMQQGWKYYRLAISQGGEAAATDLCDWSKGSKKNRIEAFAHAYVEMSSSRRISISTLRLSHSNWDFWRGKYREEKGSTADNLDYTVYTNGLLATRFKYQIAQNHKEYRTVWAKHAPSNIQTAFRKAGSGVDVDQEIVQPLRRELAYRMIIAKAEEKSLLVIKNKFSNEYHASYINNIDPLIQQMEQQMNRSAETFLSNLCTAVVNASRKLLDKIPGDYETKYQDRLPNRFTSSEIIKWKDLDAKDGKRIEEKEEKEKIRGDDENVRLQLDAFKKVCEALGLWVTNPVAENSSNGLPEEKIEKTGVVGAGMVHLNKLRAVMHEIDRVNKEIQCETDNSLTWNEFFKTALAGLTLVGIPIMLIAAGYTYTYYGTCNFWKSKERLERTKQVKNVEKDFLATVGGYVGQVEASVLAPLLK